MKSKLIAVILFTFTATGVALYPAAKGIASNLFATGSIVDPNPLITPANTQGKVEVVFVLDTTASMSGMIEAAKEKIWSIASSMASAQSAPEIRMGLVAYRDRDDHYVTRVIDLSSDIDSMYAALMDFKAGGGGDAPESVNQALHDAVHEMSWSLDNNTYRAVFLVGDAPPHMDYANDVKYPVTLSQARQAGIVVNTIQCGTNDATRLNWQEVAQLGTGQYFQADQAGSAIAISTPFDKQLATLSASLSDTRMVFGSAEIKEEFDRKEKAIEKLERVSSIEAQARRAAFNATPSGAMNLIGDNELVDALATGKVDLATIDADQLPAPLATLSVDERRQVIAEATRTRIALRDQIMELSHQRSDYLKKKVAESGAGEGSFDDNIYRAVQSQAAKVGLRYEAQGPEY